MGQLFLFFVLQLLGSWAWVAVGPRQQLALPSALGFLVGLAIAVFLSLPLLLVGRFTAVSVSIVLGGALAVAIAIAIYRARASLSVAIRLLVWAVGFVAVCLPFAAWNLSTQTYDSEQFLWYARQLQEEQQLSMETLSWLNSWGSFLIVGHALSVVTPDNYLHALAPAMSLSLATTFAVVLHRGLGRLDVSPRCRMFSSATALLVLGAVPLVRLHVFYIHANWPAAIYLFVFGSLFWLAEIEDDKTYLPFAFLGLLSFAFCRVESPMFVALFLLLALSQTKLSRAAIFPIYGTFTALLVGWLVLMAAVVPSDSEYLTPTRTLMMAVTIGGLFVFFAVRERLRWLLRWIPPLAAIASVIVTAVAAAMLFEVFRISFPIWQRDLWVGSFWGFFLWPLLSILTVLSLRVPVPPSSRALRYSIALFFVLVTLLACLSEYYRSGRYGGLTRLTLHIVPLAVFYFALAFGPVCCRRFSRDGTKPGYIRPS